MENTRGSLALSYARKGWHVFPIKKGTTNAPRVKWGTEATTDETKIGKWWAAWPNDNIGIATGPSNLCVVDVDMKKGKNGQATLDSLELDYGELPHTLRAETPSGGSHLYFSGSARTTVEQVGPGVDTRGSGGAGGYVLAPGSATDVGEYEWTESSQIPVAKLPDWLGHLTGRREDREHQTEAVVDQDQPQYIEWAIENLSRDAKPAIDGSGGNRQTFNVACVLREKGISEDKAKELMLEHYNPRCQPPWDEAELFKTVENAFSYASVVPPGGDTPEHDFGDPDMPDDEGEYGPAPINGEQEERYAGIMDDWVWVAKAKMFYRRSDGMMFDTKSFDSMYNFMLEGKGSISSEIFGAKRSMRKFDQFDFLPTRPEFCETTYNLWKDPGVEAIDGDASIFLNHIEYLISDPQEREYALKFMAWCVQNPAKKPNFALVIKGFEGTGKSFLGIALEMIFGEANTGRPMNTEIQSQYNGWARNVKLVVVEELMAKGRIDMMNHLKPMITDPRISINEKYEPAQKITNNCVIVAFTNHEDALPISDDDRRYLIITSRARPRQDDYYKTLFGWLYDQDGVGIILHHLQNMELGEFEGKGKAPRTKSKDEMRDASRSDWDGQWKHLYDSNLPPFHGRYVAEADLIEALPDGLRNRLRNGRGAARKFLVNVVDAYNTGEQTRTMNGRVVLWALDYHDKQAERSGTRTGKMRATVYNREMSVEAVAAAEVAVLGDDFDDLPDDFQDDPKATVVSLSKSRRERTDGAQTDVKADESEQDEPHAQDGDPLA